MFNAASIASSPSIALLRAPPSLAPPVAEPAFFVVLPVRTAAGRAAALDFAHRAPQPAGMSPDGRNVEGLEPGMQSIDFSMIEAIERGARGLPWSGDDAAHAADGARPSVLERVYVWCGDRVRQFLGGPGEAEPPAWSSERASAREQRSVLVEDVLKQMEARPQQPRPSGTREHGGVSVEDFLRQVGRGAPQSRSSGAGEQRSVSPEDFLREFDAHPRQARCNTFDRADPSAYFPGSVNPSLCPELARTVSSQISARAVGAAAGVQRTLEGGQGVLTRVRVALPSNAATLTVKVSREGATPGTDTWNIHEGIAGVQARVVSGDQRALVPNLANCRTTEPRTGKQVCTIPVERGRVDGKRFVTVEVFAAQAGRPILLEVASRPA
jgi:hypothetical protein